MESLKISTIYGQKNAITKDNNQNLFTIIVATSAGSMLMLLAALSFFAASIAFLLRLVILLLLMGFSPVFFVGMVFPNIQKEISGKWLDWLTKELLFMPVYLLFMYVALRFLSGQDGAGFLQTLNGSNPNTAGVLGFVGLLIQYTIAFVLINIPLLAAVKVGGVGATWGDNAKKWAGGYLGKNTLGFVGSKADKYLENTHIGNSMMGRSVRSLTTQKAANSKFGGYSSRKDDEKEDKDIKKKGREIENLRNLDKAIAAGNDAEIKRILGSMSNNEIANLDAKKHLTNKSVIPHLSSSVYSNIDKSEKSDKDKVSIRDARAAELTSAVNSSDTGKIRSIMKNMTGEDLQKYIEDGAPINDDLIAHIRSSQLKVMDGMSEGLRKQIGDSIDMWLGKFTNNHAAYKFINDNRGAWTT